MALLLTTNVQFVTEVLRENAQSEGQAMRAIAATRSLDLIVDDTLRALVSRARAAGHTWAEIGDVLHVTRQAAFQRFGGGAPAGSEADAPTSPLRGAAKRARSVLDAFLDGRWDDVRATFDDRMSQAVSVELLTDVRERVQRDGGEVREVQTPVTSMRAGLTVVDIPVRLERSSGTAQVIFDAGGRVAGFFVRPAGPAL